MSRDGMYRTSVGQWLKNEVTGEWHQVEKIWRGEDIGRFTDSVWFRGTHAAACMGRGWQRSLTRQENAETARR